MEPWPADGLEAVGACPVCGSTARSLLYDGLHDRLFETTATTWTMQRCAGCRSGYLDPRPDPATIGRAYGGDYATHAAAVGVEAPPVGRLGQARRSIRNGHVDRRLGYDLRPASPLGVLVPLVPTMRVQTDRAFRHLRRPAPGARLLDVGCGNGDYVLRMAAAGWDAVGQEIDEVAADRARASGAVVHGEPIEVLAEREPYAYDAVTLSHVIEHVHAPVGFLATLRRLLKPDGRLWLATPNLDSAGHARFGRDWMPLDPPRHLVLFTRASLRTALQSAGFADVRHPRTWSDAGDIRLRSEILRDGGRPTMTERGSIGPDLLVLLRPSRTEELVAVARPAA